MTVQRTLATAMLPLFLAATPASAHFSKSLNTTLRMTEAWQARAQPAEVDTVGQTLRFGGETGRVTRIQVADVLPPPPPPPPPPPRRHQRLGTTGLASVALWALIRNAN